MKNPATTQIFLTLLFRVKIPAPQTEYIFHPTRKWRMDYAWPQYKIALEVEGGIYTGGRHTRGAGFVGDMEKYNAATSMGWRILRVTPTDLCKTSTINLIQTTINKSQL